MFSLENLTTAEKERFSKIVNYLLNRTYVMRETYEARDKIGKINADYRFIERNFELFAAFFAVAGYQIVKDDASGIVSISSLFPTNIARLDKFTTLLCLTLRQMYDAALEKGSALNVVFVPISEIVVRMIDNKFVAKKPTILTMTTALRTLIRHNVIARYDGSLEDTSAVVAIYPTILKVVSNEKINLVYANLFPAEQEKSADTQDIF